MLQLILGFPLKLSRKNCNYWFRQPQWESVIVCWVSKLSTKANGEMLLSSNCKDCNQEQARSLRVSRLKTCTPEPQPTTPVSAPHPSVNSPLCCSHVQCVRPSVSEVDAIPQPTQSVLTERLAPRITVAPHCISTGTEMHHQGQWGFGYRLPLNSGARWASYSWNILVSRICRESAAPQ